MTARALRLLATLGLGALFAASLAAPSSAAPPASEVPYVRALYADLLGRLDGAGDAAGVDYWAGRLATESRSVVVRAIQRGSTEYHGRMVDLDYQLLLGRSADPAGRGYYVQALRAERLTAEQVVGTIAGSDEFSTRTGGTTGSFVSGLYVALLGRQPTSAERASAATTLARSSRTALAIAVASGSEAHAGHVDAAYIGYLRRSPSTAEATYWVGRLGAGLRSERFDATIVASSEYHARAFRVDALGAEDAGAGTESCLRVLPAGSGWARAQSCTLAVS